MLSNANYTPNRQIVCLLGGGLVDARKIGVRIKDARKSRGLTQSSLAQMVDLTPKYFSNIECGEKIPRLETFVAIANALEVDANSLLQDVLTVSTAIIGTEISEQLATLPPSEQRKIRRVLDVIIEESKGQRI